MMRYLYKNEFGRLRCDSSEKAVINKGGEVLEKLRKYNNAVLHRTDVGIW